MANPRGVSHHHYPLLLLTALGLACAAPGSPPPASSPPDGGRARAEKLANGSFVAELDGVAIHYEVHGRGPVLMTLPNSWGLSLEGLRALYRPLEKHLTMVYFDPRGMGGSGAARDDSDLGMAAVRADFDALRRHLGLGRVDAIGWSNGAMNLLLLASERPQILRSALFLHGVARFTAEDGAAISERHPDLDRLWTAFQEEMASRELTAAERDARTKSFTVEEYFPYLFADRERGRRLLPELYRDTAFSWRHSRYAGEEGAGFDATDRLAAITVPSLVIAGAQDLMPAARAEEIHRGIPDSRFVVFENSGHFAPVEEPERFVATVLEFLRRPGD